MARRRRQYSHPGLSSRLLLKGAPNRGEIRRTRADHALEHLARVNRDLTMEEFVVQQNEAACEVVALQPETDGMKIAVLLDTSGKVEASRLRRGLDDFLDTLPGEHEVGLFTIVNQVVRRTDFTADRDQLRQAVSDLHALRDTGVKLAEGLVDTWRRFDEADAWPVFVLVVHDGADLSPVHMDLQLRPLQGELIRRGATVRSWCRRLAWGC